MDRLDQIKVILVEPQLPENTGAVGRVMSNFGLQKLRLVNPRHKWPHHKAKAMSVHGGFILDEAGLYPSLNEAMADCHYVWAAAAGLRDMDKQVISPRAAAREIAMCLEEGIKIGLMFGRESSGLTNKEINSANGIIKIPTSKLNNSLNLAQAVAVIGYELMLEVSKPKEIVKKREEVAPRDELQILLRRLLGSLEGTSFFIFPEKRAQMRQKVEDILVKAHLTSREVRIIHGMLSALERG